MELDQAERIARAVARTEDARKRVVTRGDELALRGKSEVEDTVDLVEELNRADEAEHRARVGLPADD